MKMHGSTLHQNVDQNLQKTCTSYARFAATKKAFYKNFVYSDESDRKKNQL